MSDILVASCWSFGDTKEDSGKYSSFRGRDNRRGMSFLACLGDFFFFFLNYVRDSPQEHGRFPQEHARIIQLKLTKWSSLTLSFGPLISLGESMENDSMGNSGNIAGLSGNQVFKTHQKYLTVWQHLQVRYPKSKLKNIFLRHN